MVIPHHLSKSPSIIYLFNPRLLDGHCACFGECGGPRGPELDVWRQPLYKYVLVSTRKKEILVSGPNAYSAGSQACKWSWCLMVIVSCPYTMCMVGGCKSLCPEKSGRASWRGPRSQPQVRPLPAISTKCSSFWLVILLCFIFNRFVLRFIPPNRKNENERRLKISCPA